MNSGYCEGRYSIDVIPLNPMPVMASSIECASNRVKACKARGDGVVAVDFGFVGGMLIVIALY